MRQCALSWEFDRSAASHASVLPLLPCPPLQLKGEVKNGDSIVRYGKLVALFSREARELWRRLILQTEQHVVGI